MTQAVREIHPLALLIPSMRDQEYAELRDDIAANGLREPITLYGGQVLDGRHRLRACEETGVEPAFSTYEGDAPAAYVLSLNIKRRQLSQSQKAMVATDFLPYLREEAKVSQLRGLRQGATLAAAEAPLESFDANGTGPNPGRSAQRAAEQLGVSHAQVVRANRIAKDDPDLAERVRRGEVTVGAAHAAVVQLDNGKERAKRPPVEMVGGFIGKLRGYVYALDEIDHAGAVIGDDAPLEEWNKLLTEIIVPLNRLRGEIRKVLGNG